jgi:GDPmannose 4,6-dehydratase
MRCLVIGGSGQDGTLISAQLLSEGHAVVCLSRSPSPLQQVDHRTVDVLNVHAVEQLIAEITPDQIYYLAARHRSSQEHSPPLHIDMAENVAVNATAFAGVLDAIKRHAPKARTVYASSCRIFGRGDGTLLNESASRNAACAYGISKAVGMAVAEMFRRDRALFVSSAVLFNHESELRGETFVSMKLVRAALAARDDPAYTVHVGSLEDAADWGAARDYVAAMRSIACAADPGDFIVASGRLRTVRDFAEVCFSAVGLDWSRHVKSTVEGPQHSRRLVGDASKLSRRTGWRPTLTFEGMVRDLVKRSEHHGKQRSADFHSYL